MKMQVSGKNLIRLISSVVCIFGALAYGQSDSNSTTNADVNSPIEIARYQQQFSNVKIKPVRFSDANALAVIFECTEDIHFYADDSVGTQLKVSAVSAGVTFSPAIYPASSIFTDALGTKAPVFEDNFNIIVPIENLNPQQASVTQGIDVTISGQVCTSEFCLMPFEKTIHVEIDFTAKDTWQQINIQTPVDSDGSAGFEKSMRYALGLAFLAGLALNIMPCVWPVMPIIVMRLVSQAKKRKAVSVLMGLAFCTGILLFFAILASANIVLKLVYGTALQWGDQFRSPAIVTAMSLLLVLLAMSMFGVFTVIIPSSISGKQSTGSGFTSAIGTGLLAALLSTPCSFGILAAAFAWAQSQPLVPATIAILCIGAGMALPYAVLTAMPWLLRALPAPGRWMELFKQGVGFVLLIIAVKLLTALPQERIKGILYFAVVLAFSAWMWGKWVDFGTKAGKKWLVRSTAAALVFVAGWTFLPGPPQNQIDWQPYDAAVIEETLEQNRPVLIKFTADWCLSCQAVERTVYSRKDIIELIKQKDVLPVKADTTEKNYSATTALQEIYNEPGVPVSMLFIPGSKEPQRWRGLLFAGQLKSQLETLPDN